MDGLFFYLLFFPNVKKKQPQSKILRVEDLKILQPSVLSIETPLFQKFVFRKQPIFRWGSSLGKGNIYP